MPKPVGSGWWCLVAGLAYGALLTLAWPPMDVWWLAFLAPAPLVLAGEFVASKGTSARRAGVIAALGSLPFWFLQTRWLINVTPAGYPCLAVYMSIYVGLFVALLARLRRTRPAWALWAVAGPLWVGLEVVRGEFMLTGYPWFLAGHPLVELPVLAAPAALFGAYFVSLLVVTAVASAVSLGWRGSPRSLYALLATIALWATLALLARTGDEPLQRTLRVAVIQTNLPQSNKMGWPLRDRIRDFTGWLEMTRAAAAPDASGRVPDVIVWPETMFPGEALNPDAVQAISDSGLIWPASMFGPDATSGLSCDAFALELIRVQQELGIPMVVGAIAVDGLRIVRNEGKISLEFAKKFNSAMLISEGRIDPTRYDKHSLTPFGEVIPYAWRFPALQRAVLSLGAGGMSFDLAWGERSGPLVVPLDSAGTTSGPPTGVRFATPICFEVVRSNLCRRLVHEGEGTDPALPVLLVNLSNDGWFTDYPEGRAQHFQIARWRCVELGVPMVRSVNTGISGAIDARGRVLARGVLGNTGTTIESHAPGVLTLNVPLARTSSTPFSRWFGNTAGYGCLVATGALILASRRSPASPPKASANREQARTPKP